MLISAVCDGNEVLATSAFIQNGLSKEALAANFIANLSSGKEWSSTFRAHAGKKSYPCGRFAHPLLSHYHQQKFQLFSVDLGLGRLVN